MTAILASAEADNASAAGELRAELKAALREDLQRAVWTPAWHTKHEPAADALFEQMDDTDERRHEVVSLLRDAANGEDVTLRAQLLLSVAIEDYVAAHRDAAAEGDA